MSKSITRHQQKLLRMSKRTPQNLKGLIAMGLQAISEQKSDGSRVEPRAEVTEMPMDSQDRAPNVGDPSAPDETCRAQAPGSALAAPNPEAGTTPAAERIASPRGGFTGLPLPRGAWMLSRQG